MSLVMDDFLKAIKVIEGLPKPVSYIVLDHSWSHALPRVDGVDCRGKRYVLTFPAVLDELRHVKADFAGEEVRFGLFGGGAFSAIPVYRREDLHPGWPDAY